MQVQRSFYNTQCTPVFVPHVIDAQNTELADYEEEFTLSDQGEERNPRHPCCYYTNFDASHGQLKRSRITIDIIMTSRGHVSMVDLQKVFNQLGARNFEQKRAGCSFTCNNYANYWQRF